MTLSPPVGTICAAVQSAFSDLITLDDLSERSGIPVQTLKYRVRRGILIRANGDDGGRGKKALYHPSEIERMRDLPPARNAYLEKRRELRRQIESTGKRDCRACGRTLPLSNFPVQSHAPGGRQARCLDCQRPLWRQYGMENRAICTERRLDYDHRNREKVRAVRRDYQRRVYKTGAPAKQAMRASRDRTRLRGIAIATGKTSPICRLHGFSLVNNECAGKPGVGIWRAARLDKPIEAGERAICHYKYGIAGIRGWIVLDAPTTKKRDKHLIAALVAAERKGRKGDR